MCPFLLDHYKALVVTLGYSRATYPPFSEHERQEDWLTGIQAALHYLGGVLQDLLFHNAKCIMIERDAFGAGKHRWNSHLLQMARDYGFKLRACRPYRAKTKGKVERFNGYVNNHRLKAGGFRISSHESFCPGFLLFRMRSADL